MSECKCECECKCELCVNVSANVSVSESVNVGISDFGVSPSAACCFTLVTNTTRSSVTYNTNSLGKDCAHGEHGGDHSP